MRYNKPSMTLGRQFNAQAIHVGLPYARVSQLTKQLARIRKRHELDRKFKEATKDI